jgi:hypothetical protein
LTYNQKSLQCLLVRREYSFRDEPGSNKTGGPGLGEIVVREDMTFKRQGHHTENRILYSVQYTYMSSVGEILCGKEYTGSGRDADNWT